MTVFTQISLPGPLTLLAKFLMEFSRKLSGSATETEKSEVFRQILAEHSNLISRLCYGYAHSTEEFEDLRQDAYANIWSGLDGFRADSSLKTWVYRVTLNTCVSVLRKRSKTVPTIGQEIFADIPDGSDEDIQLVEALHRAIDTLHPLDKAVILMWLDRKSYDEIGQVCGLPRNTVAVRIHRAKEKIKIYMKNED